MAESQKTKKEKEIISRHLRQMLKEIGWANVKEIVKANKRFKSLFAQGGHQFKPQNLSRAIQIIVNNSKKYDHHYIFFKWCEKVTYYDDILEKIFSDDDDTEDAESKSYKVDEDIFINLTKVIKYKHSEIFIHLSPIEFSVEQINQLNELDKKLEEDESDKNNQDSKYQAGKDKNAAKDETKKLKAAIRSYRKDIKNWEIENKNLKIQLNNTAKELEKYQKISSDYEEKLLSIEELHIEKETKLANIIKTEKAKNQNIIKNGQTEISENKEKIENLSNELAKRTKKIEALNNELNAYKKKFYNKVTCLFEQVNTVEIIGALNEPDEVKDLLLSVVRVPQNDHSLSKNSSDLHFKKSWFHMVRHELKSIKKVSSIDINELIDSNFSQNWPDYTDLLVDLKYSLKARAAILNLISETMKQFFKEENYRSSKPKLLQKASVSHSKQNINILNLPKKTMLRLKNAGIRSVEELTMKQERELLKLRIGRNMLKQIKNELRKRNLKLA
jgi:hypothetical protein